MASTTKPDYRAQFFRYSYDQFGPYTGKRCKQTQDDVTSGHMNRRLCTNPTAPCAGKHPKAPSGVSDRALMQTMQTIPTPALALPDSIVTAKAGYVITVFGTMTRTVDATFRLTR
ncbi:Hypothetical protein W5S_0155 [Pectobacterium parmentieri]|uniref:Uncharacterized protein n=1 Tax=Pectobacterium parmentieri TaxID=1905730 RepID=A0A0H3HYA1_PECPM|nr:Hypothetical protein W5S_0155 [Pectobacterium parmentieri]